MLVYAHRTRRLILLVGAALLSGACSESAEPPAVSAPPAATSVASTPAPPVAPVSVDACNLLTQAEVEAAGARKAMAPRGERMDELSTCSWGDPEAPKMGEQPLIRVVELSVISGSSAYSGSPAEQAGDIFRQYRGGASSAEAIAGLGDDAYWDGRDMRVLRGRYVLAVKVDPESREAARSLASAALARLP